MKRSIIAALIVVPGAALAVDPVTDPKDFDGSEEQHPSVEAEALETEIGSGTDAARSPQVDNPVNRPRDTRSTPDPVGERAEGPASDDVGQREPAVVTDDDLEDLSDNDAARSPQVDNPVNRPRDTRSTPDPVGERAEGPASDDVGQREPAVVTDEDLEDLSEDAADLIDGEPTEGDEQPPG